MRKRICSLCMILALCLSLVPAAAMAARTGETESMELMEETVSSSDVFSALDEAAEEAEAPREEASTKEAPQETATLAEAPQETPVPQDAEAAAAEKEAAAAKEGTAMEELVVAEAEVTTEEDSAEAEKPPIEEAEDEENALTLESVEAEDFAIPEKGSEAALLDDEEGIIRGSGATGDVVWTGSETLKEGQRVRYTFVPSVSATYVFESTNSMGDPYGILQDANGNQLVYDDDGGNANGNGRNFRISCALTAGETYYYIARWYSSSTSGTIYFQLSRIVEVTPLTAGADTYADIENGGEIKYFSFTPSSTDTYIFESTNASGDTYGYLYSQGPGEDMLVYNDDGGSANGNGRNFRISYSLSAGHTYYYGVRWYSNSATGRINVRLSQNEKVLSQPTASSPTTDSANIETGGSKVYFRFTPSVTYTYDFESTNTSGDPYGYLYDADKSTELAHDDDSAGSGNFKIRYNLTAGHTYYYAVRFYSSSTTGRINVRLSIADDVTVLNANEVTLKGYTNNSASITESGAMKYFSFTPATSGTYILESQNSSGDPIAYLYNSVGGSQLASNDDGGNANSNSRNFKLSYTMSEGTTYYYGVKWLNSGTGTLNIRVYRQISENSASLSAGASARAEVTPLGKIVYYRFTPSNTQRYVFESTSCTSTSSNNFDPYVILCDESYNTLDTNDDGAGYPHFKFDRTFTAGSTYYFGVKRLNDSATGTVDVRLTGNTPVISIDASTVAQRGEWTGSVNIETGGSYAYFSFTPPSTGRYVFESTNTSGDTYGYLYNSGPGQGQIASNDDGGSANGNSRNFKIESNLTAGTTYYYGARWYSSSSTGTISVRLSGGTAPAGRLDASAVESNGYTTDSANITAGGQYAYWSFTPISTAAYVFESTNASGDTYGYLYSGGPGQGQIASNDDGGDANGNGRNCKIESNLTAGTTYYYGVRFYSSSTTGTISVRLSKKASVSPTPIPVTGVSVTLASSSIYVGNQTTASARVTPDNAANKTVTWSSGNSSVATVDANGIVRGVSAGSAAITARTSNGVSGSATVTILPTPTTAPAGGFYPDYSYAFPNSSSSFSTGGTYRIPVERYMQLGFTQSQANRMVENWGGSCFGMSVSSILFFKDILTEEKYNSNIHLPHNFTAPRSGSASDTKLRSMIELFQVSQNMPPNTPGGSGYEQPSFNPSAIAAELDRGNPVGFGLRETHGRGYHEVVIYRYTLSGGLYEFDIYDCSGFINHLTCTSKTNYRFTYTNPYYTWAPFDYCTYATMQLKYNALKNADANGAASLLDIGDGRRYVYIFCPVGDLTLTNAQGQTVSITDDVLDNQIEADDENIRLVLPSYLAEDPQYILIVPEDTYTISGEGLDTVAFAGADIAVEIHMNAGTPVTVSSDLYGVTIAAEDGDPYYVSYEVYNEYFDALSVRGTAAGEVTTSYETGIEKALNGDHVLVNGAKSADAGASVGDKNVMIEGPQTADKATPLSVWWPVNENGGATLQIQDDSEPEGTTDKTAGADSSEDASSKGTLISGREQLEAPGFALQVNEDGALELAIVKASESVVYYHVTDENDTAAYTRAELDELYTGPILVTERMRVIAIGTRLGYTDSEIVEWKYSEQENAVRNMGDINGDRKVNGKDLTALGRHLANWNGYSREDINYSAADLNNDDRVNGKDLTVLGRYLANWEGYETLPHQQN